MDTDQLIRWIYREGYEVRFQNVEAQDDKGRYIEDGAWIVEVWRNGRRQHETEVAVVLREALQLAADWIEQQ